MNIFVGVTDYDWFSFLHNLKLTEVNFWRAGTRPVFRALKPGELFLFKLHSPRNFIVGGGVFTRYLQLPVSATWDAFGNATGMANREQFIAKVYGQRRIKWHNAPDVRIGSIILTKPFFFPEDQWIPEPASWSANIPQGKTYETTTSCGGKLCDEILTRVGDFHQHIQPKSHQEEGAGSFSLLITALYNAQCAISGESTLPALKATHFRPPQAGGEHNQGNGILLRKDLCELFQLGYITISPNYTVQISSHIQDRFGKGSQYLSLHNRPLQNMPERFEHLPARENIKWHRDNVFIDLDQGMPL